MAKDLSGVFVEGRTAQVAGGFSYLAEVRAGVRLPNRAPDPRLFMRLSARGIVAASLLAGLLSSPAQATDWVLLYNHHNYWTSNVDLPVCRKIRELQPKNLPLKCVAFTPHGGWAILYGKNGYFAQNIPQDAFSKLGEIAAAGGTSQWIAFAPGGGWCILSAQNQVDAQHVPSEIVDKLREIGRAGSTLKSIAFTPAGGCVALYDENGVWCHGPGLPEAAAGKLAEVSQQAGALKSIAFTPGGGWTLLWNDHAHWSTGIPPGALDRIREVGKAGGTLKAIAYLPAGGQFDSHATYVLDSRPSRRVQVTLTTDIALPHAKVDQWNVYAPQVPTLPSQRDVITRFEPAGKLIRELGPSDRSLNLVQVGDGRNPLHTRLTIEATLYARRLVPLAEGQVAPTVPNLAAAEVAQFTRSSITVDYQSPAVQAWIATNHLTRAGGESDLAYAHRVFSFIKHHFTYEFPTQHHAASQACTSGVSDCGGLSAVFAAVLRSNHVPVRLLGGRWAESQTAKSRKVHVKAEFFARGIGWVPVDASSALSHANGENLFFGNDPGDHLTMMIDADVLVDSFVSGPKPIRYVQALHYWWRGSGNGKDTRFEEQWLVREP